MLSQQQAESPSNNCGLAQKVGSDSYGEVYDKLDRNVGYLDG